MKTFLDAVNQILKDTGSIAEDVANFDDTANIRDINLARSSFNKMLVRLYTLTEIPYPTEQAEGTIVLAQGVRSYPLAADLEQLRWPMIDRVNSQFLVKRAGGYNSILTSDLEQDDTGLPLSAAISPVTGELYMDYLPRAQDAGRTYTYQYDKKMILEAEADPMPFSDSVFLGLTEAAGEFWKIKKNNTGNLQLINAGLAMAAELLTKEQPRANWKKN